jgi:hypothetical protein
MFESDDPAIIFSLNILHEDTLGIAYFLGNLNKYADGPGDDQSQRSSIKVTWEGAGMNPPWKNFASLAWAMSSAAWTGRPIPLQIWLDNFLRCSLLSLCISLIFRLDTILDNI